MVVRGFQRAFAAFACLLLVVAFARPAHATAQDDRLDAAVSGAMADDYPAKLDNAKNRIQVELDKCKGGRCTAPPRARAYVALGMIASQNGSKDDAKNYFSAALALDSTIELPHTGVSADIRTAFDEVKGTPSPGAAVTSTATPAAATPAATPVPTPLPTPGPVDTPAAAAPPDTTASTDPAPMAAGTKIPGWTSTEAFQDAAAGLAADQAGHLDECIEKDKKSLTLEEQPRTRLHLSSCERRFNKFVDALKDAQKALEVGIDKRDAAVMKVARTKVEDLIKMMPHVTFVPPAGIDDLTVKFDDRDVPAASLEKRFSIDPGKHSVHAEGTVNAVPTTYDEDFDVKPSELLQIRIHLNAPRPEYVTPGQLRCMMSAKNEDDVQKCFPQNRKNIVVKAGVEAAGYADSNHVYVFTPSINASVSSPTAGWNVGGSYVLDILSAASPDIVSMASKRYRESRNAGSLTGGYKPGLYGVQAQANVSSEPDYLSRGAGLAVTGDFRDKLLTPRIGLNYSNDKIGRRSLTVDTKTLDTVEAEAGVTFILSPTSLLLVSATSQFERGDQSKPYRYIPLFSPTIASRIPVGAVIDLVNRYRLPYRPNEQLPTARDRYALGVRFAHRFTGVSSTLRLEQRFYDDDWGIKSTTTDARFVIDANKRIRVWPHTRLNLQTGANFYELAYSSITNPNTGKLEIPLYRTGDREFAPLSTITGGGGMRYALSSPEAASQWGLTVQGDVMYTRYLDSLFVTFRTAVYGSLALDVEFE